MRIVSTGHTMFLSTEHASLSRRSYVCSFGVEWYCRPLTCSKVTSMVLVHEALLGPGGPFRTVNAWSVQN